MYCDKSFQSRSSLVQHLHIHIDGNVDLDNPQTTCPISRDCYSYDATKGALSSHIVSCHPEQVEKLELDSSGAMTATTDTSMGILQRTTNETPVNSTPICAVKPLPPVSSRLTADLADTVSAIEAICSLNNETQSQRVQQTHMTSKFSTASGTLFEESIDNTNLISSNEIFHPSNSSQVRISL